MVLASHSLLVWLTPQPGVVAEVMRHEIAQGVFVFFALSGFLVAGPYLRALLAGRPLPAARRYALRRVARIYPAYWLAFAAVVLVVGTAGLSRRQVLVHLLLLQNSVPGEASAIYFVAWTLGVEVLFYAAVPVAALLVARTLGPRVSVGAMARVVLGAWVLSGAWALIGTAAIPAVIPLPPEWVEVVRFDLPALLFLFCPGMLTVLALSDEAASRGGAWAGYRWLMARPTLVVPLAAGLILAASLLVTNPQAWVFVGVHDELWGIASGLLLGLFLRGGRVVSRLSVVLAPVGLVSYGIYLWHWPLVLLLQQHQDSLPARGTPYAWLLGPVALAAMTAPLAILSWFLLERPLLRAAAGRTARREPVTGRP